MRNEFLEREKNVKHSYSITQHNEGEKNAQIGALQSASVYLFRVKLYRLYITSLIG